MPMYYDDQESWEANFSSDPIIDVVDYEIPKFVRVHDDEDILDKLADRVKLFFSGLKFTIKTRWFLFKLSRDVKKYWRNRNDGN